MPSNEVPDITPMTLYVYFDVILLKMTIFEQI